MGSIEFEGKPGEKCAVVGVISDEGATVPTVESLRSLQHRGQEASGIAVQERDGTLVEHREPGLVRDVYRKEEISQFTGKVAIGHNRYSTSGNRYQHLQPVVDASIGFAFAHNGNLPSTDSLEKKLQKHNVITSQLNDSEMMARTVATYIRGGHDLPAAIEKAYDKFQGAFSCVAMHDGMIVAFRDEKGIRPLSYANHADGWAIASETCAFDAIGADYISDVAPGEMVIFDEKRPPERKKLVEGEEKLDIFEFVYFARPDSILYGQRVNEVRRRFGEELASEHASIVQDQKDTVVVPVPDTSVAAAEGFAESLGLRHRQAIVKDRYIGRTFIHPDQAGRERQLRIKHNIIPEAIVGKHVILIDDSIVRLNTIPKITEFVLEAGAQSVAVLIASPPVRFPDFYGMDTPSQAELAAADMTMDEMRSKMRVTHLGFLPLSRMLKATGVSAERFNLSCFTGEYPVDIGNWRNTISMPKDMEYIDQ